MPEELSAPLVKAVLFLHDLVRHSLSQDCSTGHVVLRERKAVSGYSWEMCLWNKAASIRIKVNSCWWIAKTEVCLNAGWKHAWALQKWDGGLRTSSTHLLWWYNSELPSCFDNWCRILGVLFELWSPSSKPGAWSLCGGLIPGLRNTASLSLLLWRIQLFCFTIHHFTNGFSSLYFDIRVRKFFTKTLLLSTYFCSEEAAISKISGKRKKNLYHNKS